MKVSYSQGRRGLSAAFQTYTNDLGEYRLFWLAPGSYCVGASPLIRTRGLVFGGQGSDSLFKKGNFFTKYISEIERFVDLSIYYDNLVRPFFDIYSLKYERILRVNFAHFLFFLHFPIDETFYFRVV